METDKNKTPEQELIKALCAVQSEMKPVKADTKNDFFKSTYADLAAVVEQLRPILTNHGFAVSQLIRTEYPDSGPRIILTTKLMHISGACIESHCPILSKDPNDPQKMGSGITYARRYSLAAICGLPQDDDDGNNAALPKKESAPTTKKEEQKQEDCEYMELHIDYDDAPKKAKAKALGLKWNPEKKMWCGNVPRGTKI